MLCGVPALRALRAAYPDAHVALLALPAFDWLPGRFPDYLDEIVPFPGFPGIPRPACDVRNLPAFFAEVQGRRFDLALQLHGSGVITNPLTMLCGARTTVGCYLPGQYCPDPNWFMAYPDGHHEIHRALSLLEWLGVPATDDRLDFPITPQDQDELRATVGSELAGAPYVCLHPGADAAENRWPAACFAAVGDELASRGLRVVLTGSARELGLAEEVAGRMAAPALVLSGRTSLGALAALLGGARLLVCNDTGVSHLAAALRVPSVVVFTGYSDPARWAPLDGSRHRVLVPDEQPVSVRAAAQAADGLLVRSDRVLSGPTA